MEGTSASEQRKKVRKKSLKGTLKTTQDIEWGRGDPRRELTSLKPIKTGFKGSGGNRKTVPQVSMEHRENQRS